MARLMAIDYGTKRVGVAVTDEFQIIASGLTTVYSTEIVKFIEDYFSNNEVETLVVGEPKRLNNEAPKVAEAIDNFVRHLKKKFPNTAVVRQDERFTSKLAYQAISQSGMGKKKRQNKELVDEISATIILQGYMDRKNAGFG